MFVATKTLGSTTLRTYVSWNRLTMISNTLTHTVVALQSWYQLKPSNVKHHNLNQRTVFSRDFQPGNLLGSKTVTTELKSEKSSEIVFPKKIVKRKI